jgi:RNA polymerase sigma factor (TIGR02999 family)
MPRQTSNRFGPGHRAQNVRVNRSLGVSLCMSADVFEELRRIARAKLAGQKPGHTLQPTALVNEAWMKLKDHFDTDHPTPAFFKTASEAMRQILIDHARAKLRIKRGGGDFKRERVGLTHIADVAAIGEETDPDEILALNDAIARLEEEDPDTAQVVKLRFFAGLSVEETAAALGVSDRTVKREWKFARARLFEMLDAAV